MWQKYRSQRELEIEQEKISNNDIEESDVEGIFRDHSDQLYTAENNLVVTVNEAMMRKN